AQGHADGRRDLPAQMAVPRAAGGAPAGLAARRGTGAQLGTRQGGPGAHRLARWKLDLVPENIPLAKRRVAVPGDRRAWHRAGLAPRTGPPRSPRPSSGATFPRPAGNRPHDHYSAALLARLDQLVTDCWHRSHFAF